MAHEFPLKVYAVWLKDHIFTDCDQRLQVFPTRKDARTWREKHAIGCSIKKFAIEQPPLPFSETHPVMDRAIKRLNKSSREYAKAQQRGKLKVAAK